MGVLSINSGTYFGNGYTPSASGYSYGNRVASSVNINRIGRDLMSGYSQDIEILDEYLNDGDFANAMLQYESVFEDVKETAENYGYDLTDSQIRSALSDAYKKSTGNSLTAQVRKNTSNPFVQGLKEGVPLFGWFGAEAYSTSEANAKITGKEVRGVDKAAEATGGALSSAAVGAGIGTVICPGLGSLIGAGIGALTGVAAVGIKDAINNN